MKYLDLFTGIGGFTYGIQKAFQDLLQSEELQSQTENSTSMGQRGLDSKSATRLGDTICIGFSEIDKYATQVYSKHYPEHKPYGDITKINATELPDFDLLVGGFPCQAFSIAGKRGGFNDTRGTLFFDIARILRDRQPRNFILENVKGLLSHSDGNTFKTIISTLAELGYCVEWQVLNSKNFGIPQNRERVFIIGHLGGIPKRKVFPIREDGNPLITKGGEQTSDAVVSRTLTATDAKMHLDGNYIKQINHPIHSNDRVYGDNGISPTLNTMQGGRRQPKIVIPVLTPDRLEKRQNGRRFKEDGEPSFTLTSQDKHGVFNGSRIRRLTPTECERLQGFPDNWTAIGINGAISDTQRYKMCGNAVTTNVVTEVIKRLYITTN